MARPLKPCGTSAAYKRHRYHKQDACDACLKAVADDARWRYNGCPAGGPPPPRRRTWTEEDRAALRDGVLTARTAHLAAADGRREDYAWLRTEQRLTREQAAERLGVSFRTAQRYEARVVAVA